MSTELTLSSDVNIRVLWTTAMYVREKYGNEALERVLTECDLRDADLEDARQWIAFSQLSRFLSRVRELVGDEERYREACLHRLNEAYGAKRFVLMAMSPAVTIKTSALAFRIVSSVSHVDVLEDDSNRVVLRYTSTVPRELETREVCISRSIQTATLPTLFGLPPAHLNERKCIARGDACCEYEYRFLTRSHWLPAAVGLLCGLLVAMLFAKIAIGAAAAWIFMPFLGALAGGMWEFRRTYRSNLNHAEEIREALNDVARHEAEARGEILELHARQKQWINHLEEEVATRTATMQQVVDRLRILGERRIVNVRGFSHDLRNPLAVVMASIAYVREPLAHLPDCCEALDDCETSVRGMEKLLGELVGAVQQERSLVRMVPEELTVEPLVDGLRRRMRALVLGRDIRVSVFKTREAPAAIHIDPLIFERVVDNLFTNAAKYTEKGSIVVELDGSPGFLTIKVSDTGCGIDDEDIQRIFRPEGGAPERRSQHSLGIGLSVVIRLLKQTGGRLEVMSKAGQGTTFWAHFPVEDQGSAQSPATVPPQADDEVVASVVTIRKAS